MPEPVRRANGYRVYGLRDAIVLARIRRLTELGLSLDEVGDVLADDQGRELHEILLALDEDLAVQEQRIRERRGRLAVLIESAERGELEADDAVSEDMRRFLSKRDSAIRVLPESEMAERERELLALMDSTGGGDRPLAAMLPVTPEDAVRGHELHLRLDELADAAVDDPRVEALAAAIVEGVPAEVVAALEAEGLRDLDMGDSFSAALPGSVGPAQAEVLRQVIRMLAARSATS